MLTKPQIDNMPKVYEQYLIELNNSYRDKLNQINKLLSNGLEDMGYFDKHQKIKIDENSCFDFTVAIEAQKIAGSINDK